MAANEYYDAGPGQNHYRPSDPSKPHLPQDSFSAYDAQHHEITSPYASPTFQDHSFRPYEQSQHTTSTAYYASGGREQEPDSFSDDIPLRHQQSKGDADPTFRDHLPDDPTVMDAPPGSGDRETRRRRKKGFFGKKQPWVVYTFTFVQIVVFIAELVKNGVLTGSPIEIHPNFNPMIGPSPYVVINMGARFVPCMRTTNATFETVNWNCPNTTTSLPTDTSNQCSLNQLCGFGDQKYTPDHHPRQWFRFIIPIFLHAGIIHIAFNILLQLLLGRDMEIEIGSIRFFIVYVSSGIFGFVLGGNFAPEGIESTGASGSLFGVIAIMLLDLLYHWAERKNPWVDLAWIIVDIAISFVLGLLPGLDNFCHIGGFLCGLVLGVCILHSPDILRRRVGADSPPYASVKQARMAMDNGGIKGFVKEPVGFFKGRKPFWWAWWLVRAAALIGVLVGFIVLLRNFWATNPQTCSWCKHLSCLPIKNWCDIGNLQTTNTTTSKRDLFDGLSPVFMGDW